MNKITVHSNTVLRTPLLPYNTVFSFIQDEQTLKEAYQNPVLQEALFIASPDLYEQLLQWLNGKKSEQKLVHALLRYLLRMSFRPTPFGLFAGVSSVSISNESNSENSEHAFIELQTQNYYTRNLSLDMQLIGSILQKLNSQKEVRQHLKYFPNTSLYKQGNQFRYVEYKYEGKYRKYNLTAIDYNEYISVILQFAANGVTIHDLALQLSSNFNEQEQTIETIHQLIDAQILVSELELTVTGEDSSIELLLQLGQKGITNSLIDLIENLLTEAEHINKAPLGEATHLYQNIITAIESANFPFEKAKLFQTDLHKPIKNGLIPSKYHTDIISAISLLSKLNSHPSKTILQAFAQDYYERYEEQEMPLLQVLDVESGIAFPANQNQDAFAPLVDDILIQNFPKFYSLELNKIDDFYFTLLQKALKESRYQIEITENQVKQLNLTEAVLPHSFSAMASVIYEHDKELIFLSSAGGTSASQLIGRFCHTDKNIQSLCVDIAEYEKRKYQKAIRAEIIHIPETRLGNILQRPVLSEYEIPYLGKSALSPSNQIPVSDLLVSVKNNDIILRSQKLGKRVFPVLSSAHNFSSHALPVYQFLCSLQLQNVTTSLNFSWGVWRNRFQFLPRVTFKNIILSPATWQLKKENYTSVIEASGKEELQRQVKLWKTSFTIPRYVAIADGDNELTLDLENDLCISVFREELKKRSAITLIESYVNEHKALVNSGQNLYTNQFVFAFKNEARSPQVFNSDSGKPTFTKRNFIIGEEWLYYKIYCGTSSSDGILLNAISPVIKQLMKNNLITEWFFIRYADPKNHIRIRFRLSVEKNITEVTSKIKFYLNQFLSSGSISKIVADTYSRELERYGFATINQVEKIFYHDSELQLSILQQNIPSQQLWKIALYNTLTLLNDFGFTNSEKVNLAAATKNSLFDEHGLNQNNKPARETINLKYRSFQKEIIAVLNNRDSLVNSLATIFSVRSEQNLLLINDILKTEPNTDKADLAGSIIHMSLNRVFPSKQRLQELIIYDFLNRGLISVEKIKN